MQKEEKVDDNKDTKVTTEAATQLKKEEAPSSFAIGAGSLMQQSYCEHTVMQAQGAGKMAIRFALIAGILLAIWPGMAYLGTLTIFMVLIFGLAIYIVFPRLNSAIEYVFCDGSLEFSRITGAKERNYIESQDGAQESPVETLISGDSRKVLKKIDFDNVEICAPALSHSLDSFKNKDGVKTFDYTSKIKDNGKVYSIACKNGGSYEIISFEPSKTMLELMKKKAPRKVSEV